MATYINGHTQGLVGSVSFTLNHTNVNAIFNEYKEVTGLVADYGFAYGVHFSQVGQGRYGVEINVLLVGVTEPEKGVSQLELALRGFPDIQNVSVGTLRPYTIAADYIEGDAIPPAMTGAPAMREDFDTEMGAFTKK